MLGGSPRMPWWRRWFGTRSERAAERFLRRLGYRIVARNYLCPQGELDLIAVDPDRVVVFVEVRSTASQTDDGPMASIGQEKQRRLTQAALFFLKQKGLLGRPARFDVLTLTWPPGQRQPTIRHVPNAFESVGVLQPFT